MSCARKLPRPTQFILSQNTNSGLRLAIFILFFEQFILLSVQKQYLEKRELDKKAGLRCVNRTFRCVIMQKSAEACDTHPGCVSWYVCCILLLTSLHLGF